MRLENIILKNWSCHESLEADLSDNLEIIGRNGTGKSSILDAIRFIFKKTAAGYSKKIRNGSRSSTVRLKLCFDGKTYLIEKKLYIDKASTALMTCDDVQIADNPSAVHQSLNNILNEEILDKLLYVPQGGLTLILDQLSGREGKVEMDRLFGLDKLERIWQKVGEELKEEETRVKILKEELSKHPEDAFDKIRLEINELGSKKEELNKTLVKAVDKDKRIKEGLLKIVQELELLEKVKKEIEENKSILNNLDVELAKITKDIEGTRIRLSELKIKKEKISGLTKQKKNLEKYSSFKTLLIQQKDFKTRLTDLSTDSDDKRISELGANLKQKPVCEKSLNDTEEQIKDLEKKQTEYTLEVNNDVKYIDELSSLDGSSKCPRCGKYLDKKHLEMEKTNVAKRLDERYHQLKKIETEIKNTEPILMDLKNRFSRLQKDEGELEQLKKRHVDLLKTEKEYKIKIDDIDDNLSDIGYTGENIKEVEEKIAKFNKVEGIINELEKETSIISSLDENLVKLTVQNNDSTIKKDKITKELAELEYDDKKHDLKRIEKDSFSEEKYKVESLLGNTKKDISRIDERTLELNESLEKYDDIKKRYEESLKKTKKLVQARDVFHRDKGLVKYLRESYVGGLNRILTQYFSRFNQNPKYIDVSFTKDYEILFKTTSGNLGLDQISGGEKIQLAIALRLALIDLMSPVRILILDEPFGSLDEPHREVLGEAITKISSTGQMILVTHVEVESLQLPNKLELTGY